MDFGGELDQRLKRPRGIRFTVESYVLREIQSITSGSYCKKILCDKYHESFDEMDLACFELM